MDLKLPKVLLDLLTAQKNYDSNTYADCFSETALVIDEEKEYKGIMSYIFLRYPYSQCLNLSEQYNKKKCYRKNTHHHFIIRIILYENSFT
ncbi:hypothetical protein [Parabacteroides sp. Marseille-P3160]|uniref:hypothetical protein n=1 Tax=Parabacteroides sp. Marseille-P3160 TaxID=1917887 RepID=UPI0009BA86B6|nr:hypothetical protein [Parabacteroides sp. Marseille-P3160]